jgi:LPS export ABC transporter protein LptC
MTAARRIRLLRRVLVSVMVIVCGGIAAAYVGYRYWRATPAAHFYPIAERTALSMDHVHHIATRDGRTEWILDARQASLENESRILHIEQPRLEFYPRQGDPVQVEAGQGRLYTASNDIELQDQVVVKNLHYRLDTQKMRYDHAHARIKIPTAVEVHGNAGVISADRMTMDLKGNRAEMVGSVKGTLSGTTIW